MPLGLYISVPFCRSKCTYCNFASDVFSRVMFEKYVEHLCAEIEHASENASAMEGLFERDSDTVYFGGGTPTLLDVALIERVFAAIVQNFSVGAHAEITVECAPGTLSEEMLDCFVRNGVNRVSLGVQSFADQEARSVGRLHNREIVLNDIARLRASGISNVNIDLIAGLPHQTIDSWNQSLDRLIATEVPHASVYMLEVDEDSRLGRELIAGGEKYHAHFVPDEDLTADMYEIACERLNAAGIDQYEISNFARAGLESKHNLKYWTRQPYLGFGVDAHSMLMTEKGAVRFANPGELDSYLRGERLEPTFVSRTSALEENCFLGLRLTRGINLGEMAAQFGAETARIAQVIEELMESGLIEREGEDLRLTAKGRLLSNEVFEQFICTTEALDV
jgi:oxygen-independent coproporphyrinogen III oxidase